MFDYLRKKWEHRRRRRTFREYGALVKRFELPQAGVVEYAQWLHPFEDPKTITQAHVDFYRQFLGEGDVALDIGAHTGDTTVPMALAAGPGGCVLAFEPNPYVFKILAQNARLNPARTRIIPLNFAATETAGRFTFNYSDASFCNGGLLSSLRSQRHHHHYLLEVEGRNLEAYLAEHHASWLPRLRLVKIDAEGYDRHVLRSISGLLRRTRPFILSECYKRLTEAERNEFFELIVSLEYTPYRVGDFVTTDKIRLATARDLMRWPHFDMLLEPNQAP